MVYLRRRRTKATITKRQLRLEAFFEQDRNILEMRRLKFVNELTPHFWYAAY